MVTRKLLRILAEEFTDFSFAITIGRLANEATLKSMLNLLSNGMRETVELAEGLRIEHWFSPLI